MPNTWANSKRDLGQTNARDQITLQRVIWSKAREINNKTRRDQRDIKSHYRSTSPDVPDIWATSKRDQGETNARDQNKLQPDIWSKVREIKNKKRRDQIEIKSHYRLISADLISPPRLRLYNVYIQTGWVGQLPLVCNIVRTLAPQVGDAPLGGGTLWH